MTHLDIRLEIGEKVKRIERRGEQRRGEEAATAAVKSGGCPEGKAERRARIREGGVQL